MSLNWQFHDVERFKAIKGDTLNDTFIWGCLIVGIGEITEANAEEWFMRYTFSDLVNGPYNHQERKESDAKHQITDVYRITLEDTRKRIGLRTNVFPKKTQARFLKDVWEIYAENQRREMRNQKAVA